jgi:hypothetical protein
MLVKYANVSGVVRWSGGTTVLSAGITTADDDYGLVVERPDLWTDEGPVAHLAGPGRNQPAVEPEPPVERATRAPGEKRPHVRKAQGPAANG